MEQRQRAPWQNAEQDKSVRQEMIRRIYGLLRQRKPTADPEWLKKLPDMARRLEDKLYRQAPSKEDYQNETTLKVRLQQIATDWRHTQGQDYRPPTQDNQPVTVSTQGIQPLPVHQSQHNVPPSPASSYPMPSSSPGTPHFPDYPQGSPTNYNGGGGPNTAAASHNMHYQQASSQGPPPQTMYKAAAASAPPASHPSSMGSASATPGSTVAGSQNGSSSGSQQQQGPRNGVQPSQRDVLRQQQQRLLLLRHASKCPAKAGECKATPHCAQMKQLWKHIASCKETDCRMPHCVSSRFVLSHYHRCTDQMCDVCQPVRQAIAAKSQGNASAGPSPGMGQPQPQLIPGMPPQQQQQQQQQQQNQATGTPRTSAHRMPNGAPSSGGGPQPQQPPMPTGGQPMDPRLQDALRRYSEHWRVITMNADAAKKKQEAFEKENKEVHIKESEHMQAREEERELTARYEATHDVYVETQLDAVRYKCEALRADITSSQMKGRMLEAEVKAMKLQHERNIQKEKELQRELHELVGNDTERVKKLMFQGRQYAQQQQQQQAAMQAGGGGHHPPGPPSMNPAMASGGRPQQYQQPPMGAQTVAQIPAQAVVKGKAKKEPKEPKAPKAAGKQSKKEKAAAGAGAEAGAQSPNVALNMYPIPGMGVPPPAGVNVLQRQGSGLPQGAVLPPGGVPPPPPVKTAAGGRSVSQQAVVRQPVVNRGGAGAAAAAAGAAAAGMIVPASPSGHHVQMPVAAAQPVFRQSPEITRSILDTSLINTFVRKDIEAHIQSLGRIFKETQQIGKTLTNSLLSLLSKCEEYDPNRFFANPVDPVRDEAPGYLDIVKKPMDFSTLRKNIENNVYSSVQAFVEDARLVYSNCMRYNPPDSVYHLTALDCARQFEKDYVSFIEAEEERSTKDRYDQNKCRLCGGAGYHFEQVVYYCSGPCQQRIRRSHPMYSSSDNRHWCNNCFQNDVPDSILLNDGTTINKRELRKGRLPDPVEEGWVNCSSCKRWFHQVCAMLNTKRGQDTKKDDFLCPFCVLCHLDAQKKDRIELPNVISKPSCAKDLPETELSKFLEAAVRRRVIDARKEYCAKTDQHLKDVEDVSQLSVRVVMAKDTDVWTRAGMLRVYPSFPKSFNSRQKVILMFEKLDGVDTLIFIMFLQHYGSDCPPPNDRCLYIAYLDSVFYFRPSFVRTAVYHELITSVLDFERRRGITRCFIWACPPTGGDDYIFHVHPKTQKTPKPDRLKMWYLTLLEDARLRGIVTSVTNLFDEYLSRVSDLMDVPYFEGDCWPTYAEHYIVEMETKRLDPLSRQPRNEAIRNAQSRKSSTATAQNETTVKAGGPKRQKRAKSALPAGASKHSKGRSASVALEVAGGETGSDEMDVVSDMPAGLLCPLPKPLEQVPLQSLIAARIAAENDRMKDDFIVVKMFYDCVECSAPMDYPGALYWVPKIYSPEKDPHDYKKRKYAPPYCLCNECYTRMYTDEYGAAPVYDKPAFPPPEWEEEYKAWLVTRSSGSASASAPGASTAVEAGGGGPASAVTPPPGASSQQHGEDGNGEGSSSAKRTPEKDDDKPAAAAASSSANNNKRKMGGPGRKRKATGADVTDLDTADSQIDVLEPGKNARPPNPYGPTPPIPLNEMRIEVAMIRPKTVDPDPLMDCQIFALREDFLSLCQGNKYQFDELRRAKHSSMMILYHLHNPDSDAFVHTCNNCKQDIVTARYTCPTCQDFDLCQNCHGSVRHAHALEKVTSTSSSLGGEEGGEGGMGKDGQAGGKRMTSQAQYLQMLEHAAKCDAPNCAYQNCGRMKRLLEHSPTCQVRISGGCGMCKRYWQFLAFHARQCRAPNGQCKVPHCERIKGHIRAQANKVADRRMMALMQRTNQSPAPAAGGGGAGDGSQQDSAQQAAMGFEGQPTPQQQGQGMPSSSGGPAQHQVRSLTSPRGKGGKGAARLPH